jgi:hypothetical protein
MLVMPVALLGLHVGSAVSQCPMTMHHQRGGQPYTMTYDASTVETVEGDVLRVDTITPSPQMAAGLHLIMQSADGELVVHLGPTWYLEHQAKQIAVGDRVVVTGSRVTLEGESALIAAQIRIGDDVLTLRDANGRPTWAGWRRRM